jgi:hypothetical protein
VVPTPDGDVPDGSGGGGVGDDPDDGDVGPGDEPGDDGTGDGDTDPVDGTPDDSGDDAVVPGGDDGDGSPPPFGGGGTPPGGDDGDVGDSGDDEPEGETDGCVLETCYQDPVDDSGDGDVDSGDDGAGDGTDGTDPGDDNPGDVDDVDGDDPGCDDGVDVLYLAPGPVRACAENRLLTEVLCSSEDDLVGPGVARHVLRGQRSDLLEAYGAECVSELNRTKDSGCFSLWYRSVLCHRHSRLTALQDGLVCEESLEEKCLELEDELEACLAPEVSE